jgi:ABC-type uncharacterized transport system auxiliary subunit
MRRIVPYFAGLILVSCCGYSFRAVLPPHLKTLAIAPIENQTIKPNLDVLLSNQLVSDFQKDGTLKITTPDKADLTLHCQISSYDKTAQAYTGAQEVSAWQITLGAKLTVNDNVKVNKMFDGPVSVQITYDPTKETEDQGVGDAITSLSAEVLRRTLISW